MLAILTIYVGRTYATEYAEIVSIASGDVVTASSYAAYNTTVSSKDWVITFGGNNKSVGTNGTNRSSCTLANYTKYAVSPVTSSATASAFVSKFSISNVCKISYQIGGGKNQAGKVYLIYSSDNTTFSQISTLTTGSQGAAIPDASTAYNFIFTKCSGYFGLVFIPDNSSGDWRIDDVSITFYKEKVMRTVQWKVQGENYTTGTPSTSVAVGDKVETLPTPPAGAPTNCGVFKGWTETANYSDDDPPTDLFTTASGAPTAVAGSGPIVYHAVFADIKSVDP